jgi:hypothetical protein
MASAAQAIPFSTSNLGEILNSQPRLCAFKYPIAPPADDGAIYGVVATAFGCGTTPNRCMITYS